MPRVWIALLGSLVPVAAFAAGSECGHVEGGRILARDLAKLVPLFEALPPEEPIGFAPLPGAQRVFRGQDLARLAGRYGLKRGPMQPVCFVVPAEPLTAQQVDAAIRTSLSLPPDSTIELLDYSKQPVPGGALEFSPSLSAVPGEATMIRGRIRFGERRSVPVWARARIRVKRTAVIAAANLAAGEPIGAHQLRVEEIEGLPSGTVPIADIQLALGRAVRRPVPEGTPLVETMLSDPKDIERGDVVEVLVTSGAAKISIAAKASAGGRRGDQIALTNTESGRKFTARIDGPGRASVTVLPKATERAAAQKRVSQ